MIPASRLVLGTANFGTDVSKEDALSIIDYALDQGILAIDTADSYGNAEEIVGEALTGKRDKVMLATKVGNPTPLGSGLSQAYMNEAIRGSLSRLRTDYVDFYFAHNFDRHTSLTETLLTFDSLVKSEVVRSIGCSNFTFDQLREIVALSRTLDTEPPRVLQPVYNAIERSAENDLFPFAEEHHMKVWTYSPLAGGVLTGKYAAGVPKGSRAEKYPNADPREAGYIPKLNPATVSVGKHVAAIAQEYTVTPSQLAIAWTLSHPAVTAVVIGLRSRQQLESILMANVPPEAVRSLTVAMIG